jgi:molybdopterin molybdotransferase
MRPSANPVQGHHLVDAAISWVDAAAYHLDTEDTPLLTARGRVLTEDIRTVRPIPTSDRAALDGFAVQASATLGASTYNPIRLPLIAVAAGNALPPGTDAVIPLELAELDERAYIEVVEAAAAGHNVEQQGAVATIGRRASSVFG